MTKIKISKELAMPNNLDSNTAYFIKSGTGFDLFMSSNDASELLAMNMSPDLNYFHEQNIPAQVWTIEHNLGKYPSVNVLDSSGSEIIGDIQYLNSNTVQLNFSAAFSGTATLN